MSSHPEIKRAVEAVTARAKALEPPYEERIDALRTYKRTLLEAKRSGLSARQIHEELSKNIPFHITYKAVLAVLHEAEEELNGAAPKKGLSKNGEPIVFKKKPLQTKMIPSLSQLANHLTSRVRGQEFALQRVGHAVCRAELGFSKPDKPKSTFLFLGPTGVGKTETALTLAEFLFGDRKALHRFDMAEYQSKNALARFLGESKASQGLLGDAIDASPNGSIFLFDEIEKADRDFLTVFLAIMDAARVTMTNGSTKDLSKSYLVFTSNLGCARAIQMDEVPYSTMERVVTDEAKHFFRPEAFARFKHPIVFQKLSFQTLAEICRSYLETEIAHVQSAIARRIGVPVQIAYDRSALSFLVDKGYSPLLGARPMQNAVEHHVGVVLSQWVLAQGEHRSGVPVKLHLSAPHKNFQVNEQPASMTPAAAA